MLLNETMKLWHVVWCCWIINFITCITLVINFHQYVQFFSSVLHYLIMWKSYSTREPVCPVHGNTFHRFRSCTMCIYNPSSIWDWWTFCLSSFFINRPGRKRDFSPLPWSQYFETMEDVEVENENGKDISLTVGFCFSGEKSAWIIETCCVAITQSIQIKLGHFRFSYVFTPVCYLTWCRLCYSCAALVCISLTTLNIFRIYCSGSHGPVLLLLHGGGHSALSWAVFTVSIITITKTLTSYLTHF